MMIKKYFISLLLLLFTGLMFAQKTQFYLDKDASYKLGLELFDKKKYGLISVNISISFKMIH